MNHPQGVLCAHRCINAGSAAFFLKKLITRCWRKKNKIKIWAISDWIAVKKRKIAVTWPRDWPKLPPGWDQKHTFRWADPKYPTLCGLMKSGHSRINFTQYHEIHINQMLPDSQNKSRVLSKTLYHVIPQENCELSSPIQVLQATTHWKFLIVVAKWQIISKLVHAFDFSLLMTIISSFPSASLLLGPLFFPPYSSVQPLIRWHPLFHIAGIFCGRGRFGTRGLLSF